MNSNRPIHGLQCCYQAQPSRLVSGSAAVPIFHSYLLVTIGLKLKDKSLDPFFFFLQHVKRLPNARPLQRHRPMNPFRAISDHVNLHLIHPNR
jgi:hypothetical protein